MPSLYSGLLPSLVAMTIFVPISCHFTCRLGWLFSLLLLPTLRSDLIRSPCGQRYGRAFVRFLTQDSVEIIFSTASCHHGVCCIPIHSWELDISSDSVLLLLVRLRRNLASSVAQIHATLIATLRVDFRLPPFIRQASLVASSSGPLHVNPGSHFS